MRIFTTRAFSRLDVAGELLEYGDKQLRLALGHGTLVEIEVQEDD